MTYQLEITREAKLDIQDAWIWYENNKAGLGDDFILNLEAGISQITRQPLTHEVKYKEVRVCLLRRFPYKIMYTILETKILVLAVLHSSRDPEIWKERAD